VEEDESDVEEEGSKAEGVNANAPLGDGRSLDLLFPLDRSPVKASVVKAPAVKIEPVASHEDHLDNSSQVADNSSYNREREDYILLQQRINYYNDVFGSQLDKENDVEMEKTLLMHALSYGPEQTAVYSREFAQGAAACCPNGCREERLLTKSLKELEEMEEHYIIEVEQSFVELTQAQNSNVESVRMKNAPQKEESSVKNGSELQNLKKVKSVDDVPNNFDVETELYSRTPTKFSSHSRDDSKHHDVSSWCATVFIVFLYSHLIC